MKRAAAEVGFKVTTLQHVLDRLVENRELSTSRRRDLRSAIMTLAKLREQSPASVRLDIPEIREALDQLDAGHAKVSAKRLANLRSDVGAALDASALVPLLRTANISLTAAWHNLLTKEVDLDIQSGLSRFARWASGRGLKPEDVNDGVIEQFEVTLLATSLARNIPAQRRTVAKTWNKIAAQCADIQPVAVTVPSALARRISWDDLSTAFRDDVHRYLNWCAQPNPLDEGARVRALAPKTLRLRQQQIHSAVNSAGQANIDVSLWTSLGDLVAIEAFRSLLSARWATEGQKLSAYTNGIAGLLISIASEWKQLPAETIASLKLLRRKLGNLPSGLTEKNRAFLRKVSDPQLSQALLLLPEKLWRNSMRGLLSSRRPFVDLQAALAIDILLHVPLRMENLSALSFGTHLHWPRGRGKPALITFRPDETKNRESLEFEVPKTLADRLWIYKTEIVPKITGAKIDALFVSWNGTPRKQATITLGIEKAVLRNLGLKLTPHQFRHFAAKIILDENPGAIVQVSELLGHKNIKTTSNFYAGIDTKRAGRAHADLLANLRGSPSKRKRRSKLRL